ncbi:four helix bundle protein [Candidatus Uhrbacteria bacterium]|nr:four helix bundle protein [Candidatus Uhrbacteria bacterium]
MEQICSNKVLFILNSSKEALCYPPPAKINYSHSRNPCDVPIVRSIYIAYAFWNEVLNKFPKTQRHLLGTKCAEYLLQILELTLATAQASEGKEKAVSLRQASVKLDTLKLLIRLCKNCKCVSNSTYLQMESQLQEIGRMLGGWSKSVS